MIFWGAPVRQKPNYELGYGLLQMCASVVAASL